METSSRNPRSNALRTGAYMTRVITPDFKSHEPSDQFDDHQFSNAGVTLVEYALLAALLLVLIVGVVATTSSQIGSDILALL